MELKLEQEDPGDLLCSIWKADHSHLGDRMISKLAPAQHENQNRMSIKHAHFMMSFW